MTATAVPKFPQGAMNGGKYADDEQHAVILFPVFSTVSGEASAAAATPSPIHVGDTVVYESIREGDTHPSAASSDGKGRWWSVGRVLKMKKGLDVVEVQPFKNAIIGKDSDDSDSSSSSTSSSSLSSTPPTVLLPLLV